MEADGRTTEELRQLLRTNNFFPEPELWIEFARAHSLRAVSSERRMECPSCGSAARAALGQYIYYSSLIRLQCCAHCDLIYSDVLLSPEVISKHFESAYKDESYFVRRRQAIFSEIAERVATLLPKGGSVLDIGGAKGHLANEILRRRPDARIVVNDISQTSCDFAEQELGFATVCGGITTLGSIGERFDVVLGIDVAYYEPNLREAWQAFAALTAPNGHLLLRFPNRLRWIRFVEWLNAWGRRLGSVRQPQSRVASFNPEHIYIFSRRYIDATLRQHGFSEVRHLPSHFLASKGIRNAVRQVIYRLVSLLASATNGKFLLSSSQLVIAKRHEDKT